MPSIVRWLLAALSPRRRPVVTTPISRRHLNIWHHINAVIRVVIPELLLVSGKERRRTFFKISKDRNSYRKEPPSRSTLHEDADESIYQCKSNKCPGKRAKVPSGRSPGVGDQGGTVEQWNTSPESLSSPRSVSMLIQACI